MNKANLSIAMSIAAILLSIYAVFVCDKRIEADWMGILVGVLALLVTVLIGWNIYALIDFNRAKKEMDVLKEKMRIDVNSSLAISSNDMFMVYHYLLLKKDPLGLEYRLIQSGLASLVHLSAIGHIRACNEVVRSLKQCIVNPNEIIISKKSKDELLFLLSEVKQSRLIDSFQHVAQIVASLKVRD